MDGKKVYELLPDIDWDKGKAVLWLLETLELERGKVLPIYIGDDRTDEDAFSALENRGVGILVSEQPQVTAASYWLTIQRKSRNSCKRSLIVCTLRRRFSRRQAMRSYCSMLGVGSSGTRFADCSRGAATRTSVAELCAVVAVADFV